MAGKSTKGQRDRTLSGIFPKHIKISNKLSRHKHSIFSDSSFLKNVSLRRFISQWLKKYLLKKRFEPWKSLFCYCQHLNIFRIFISINGAWWAPRDDPVKCKKNLNGSGESNLFWSKITVLFLSGNKTIYQDCITFLKP